MATSTRSPVRFEDVRVVLVDIEGTTSPTAVVHGTLFGDSRARVRDWLHRHHRESKIATALADARAEGGLAADASLDDTIDLLVGWIDADRKATPLKTIQGEIWAEGFAAGRLQATFFPDVVPALLAWRRAGLHLAVFSSGSIAVQQPWFGGVGARGDAFTDFFDTLSAGPKQEAASYTRIAAALGERWGVTADQIVFASDVPAELDAARLAGVRTLGLARPGEPFGDADFGTHPAVDSLADVEITPAPDPTALDTFAAGAALAAEAARMTAQGWMRATSGNLSVAVRHEPVRLVVTASGVDKGELRATDVVVVDESGAPVLVDGLAPLRPTAEAELHAAIVAHTGAGAVVHVHAQAPVIAAERWPDGVPVVNVEMVKSFGFDADSTAVVPVIANSQSMDELARRFRAVYDSRVPAVIVARHGMYVWGDDLVAARHHVEGLEWALSFIVATTPAPPPA